jgi:hypothetical protein
MIDKCTCATCEYSRTEEIYDPVIGSMKDTYLLSMPEIDIEKLASSEITKCYIQGAPQKVNKNEDWCYSWRAR